jgi:transposase
LDTATGQVTRRRLVASSVAVLDWLRELAGPVAVAYEAGPTGFGVARELTAAGVRCVVAAPSKLQRPAGDRIKTDARDALHLARLLRMDKIVAWIVDQRHTGIGAGRPAAESTIARRVASVSSWSGYLVRNSAEDRSH